MREYYESQLAKLNTEMIQMGARCEDAISGAIQALLENNRTLAEKVDDFELEIDQYERDIERLCMRLLLLQQPVATDLRMVSSALKMISDLSASATRRRISQTLPSTFRSGNMPERCISRRWQRQPSAW